jgi:hypothetical protein
VYVLILRPSLLFWKRPGMTGAAPATGTTAHAIAEAAVSVMMVVRILLSILEGLSGRLVDETIFVPPGRAEYPL